MTKLTKSPNTIAQSSGTKYVSFSGLNNIKNTSAGTYAVSSTYIQSKNSTTQNRPATVSATNFKFNIPSSAVVKKITVHYRHSRRARCKKGSSYVPCASSSVDARCNIPAPTISVLNTGLSKKGQSPYAKIKKSLSAISSTTEYGKLVNTVTFTGLWNASVVNSNDFGVRINYPANTNSLTGYVLLNYIYVDIEYFTPNFTVSAQSTNPDKVYNKEQYHLKINLSDSNLTKKTTNVLISTPTGFNYSGVAGTLNGNISIGSGRTLQWTPNMANGNASVELVFDTDVSFAQSQISQNFPFTIGLPSYSRTIGYTATIYKELPPEKQIEDETPTEQELIDKEVEVRTPIIDRDVENTFTFTIPDDIWDTIVEFYCEELQIDISDAPEYYYAMQVYLYVNDKLRMKVNNNWTYSFISFSLDSFDENKSITVPLKGVTLGATYIALYDYRTTVSPYITWNFIVNPLESDLTIPNFTLLTPNTEETNRLGAGYGYTVQSNMKMYGLSMYYENIGTITDTKATGELYASHGSTSDLPEEFIIEFDIKATGEWGELKFQSDDTTNPLHYFSIKLQVIANVRSLIWDEDDFGWDLITGVSEDTYYHIKIVRSEGSFKIYVDDELKTTVTVEWFRDCDNLKLYTYVQDGSVSIKDIIIYFGEGERYVRDWYKNFRLGVFNNPILANITSYYQYKNTDTNFDGYLTIPSIYSLEGATLTVETDADIVFDGETVSTTKQYTDIEEYNIPVHFEKASENNVILTLTLTDGENQVLWAKDLHILFESDETTNIEEISTDNTDYDALTDVEIFSNAEYWATEVAGLNTTNSVECEFPYNNKYPLYVLITGDYPEGNPSTIEFSEPCIIETTQYSGREENGTYPSPIDDLVVLNGSTSDLTLTPYEQSETIVFYNLPLEDGYGTDSEKAIRGIELVGNIEQSDALVLYAKLKSPKGESRERSIIINDFETTLDSNNQFHIGGNGDLWGFNTLDIVELDNWEVEFRIANTLDENDSTINFGEIKLVLYVESVQKQNISCKIEGEDIAYYGAFLTDLNIPEGLKTDTDYLSVDGTDINDAYRQNIREKQITIEFDIGDGCDLETSTFSLREFTKLLVNDRDEYNRPIPKRIEFSHYPDVYWEYVIEDELDSELDINTYQVKATLIVPAGTSYDKKTTTTSNTGYVNGLASINPVLIVKPADEVVTIRETVSGQEFHVAYSGGWNDKILEIDCENRICWLETDENDTDPINLNKYVDYNSDWFVLKGEFGFEGINCIIRTVRYQERW